MEGRRSLEQPLDGERLVATYRRGKNKRETLEQMAKLNALTEAELIDILLVNGLSKKELPRYPRKAKEENAMPKGRPVEEQVLEKLELPAVPASALCDVIQEPVKNTPAEPPEAVQPLQAAPADRPIPWELLPVLTDVRNLIFKYPDNTALRQAARSLISAMAEEVA
ncbi:MAG: hypothetical protein MJ074_07145 [Oscillospiraceae bacterium]|nr:hypothetical protein [Oscillospiraceae bacterium]